MNNESECFTETMDKKHSKTMDKNTRATRSCFHHYFLVFGYPGETIARVVYMASQMNRDMYFLAARKNNGD